MENTITNIDAIWKSLDMLWTLFFSSIGGTIVYSIGAVIWGVKLGGRVRSNENLFHAFCEASEKRDERLYNSIENIQRDQMELNKMVSNIQGKMNGVK